MNISSRPSSIVSSMIALWGSAGAFMGNFARFSGRRLWTSIALVAFAAIVDGAGLLLLLPIIDVVVSRDGGHLHTKALLDSIGVHSPMGQLAVLLAAFVCAALLRAFVLYARDMRLALLQGDFAEHERNKIMRTLAGAPWVRIAALSHARITSLISVEVNRIGASAQFMIQGSVSLMMLVVQGALAIVLAPGLALTIIAILVVGGGAIMLAQGRIRDIGTRMVDANHKMMGSATGFLGGLKAATAQNAQGGFVEEFATIQRSVRGRQIEFMERQARAKRLFAIGSSLMGAAVVLTGYAATVSPATLITLVLIFGRMSGPALMIQQSVQNFFFGLPAFEAIRNLETELSSSAAPMPVPVPPPPGAIELQGASFLHPGGGGLRPTSLRIEPGEFIGITGPSGAGKTTLVELLTTLQEPQVGRLLIGGEPLDAARQAGWRESLAYVPQEGFLFNDTIRRNLTWGSASVAEPAIWEALRLAGADEIVARLPAKLDSLVGERGTALSGGERQRLAIARALLRDPRLLVLDEAANAIDAAGEKALLERLAALDPRPTIVMISHRAESLIRCDRVITIESGQLSG
ncbi:ABC transporter ATP-binding protein [Sphingomonas oligophenolica]|uniref:ABC transporter ATP-binding protein n=1 Tax=Sphingomonas oligophenolica TaxID=301154 RepID=A0ABU9Y486_9SPHN